ncbi:MAG: LON peptidase substrate-binding domain-containing protein [Frankia sp.]|nr:LON peptidase substrate-binding domain-containing protein [Frankia sp.]
MDGPAGGRGGADGADATAATARIPLFPLGTVLLPGLLLPLQVFEPRYRQLVAELLAMPDDQARQFGVVAIRHGREVGEERPELHEIGCTAVLRRVERHPDGRYSLLTVGDTRFALRSVDQDSRPYLVGEVTFLADHAGDAEAAAAAVPVVQSLLREYITRLSEKKALEIQLPDLPDDPVSLSYLVAAAVVPDIAHRQELLAAPDAVSRLRAEQALLRREIALLNQITTIASPGLARIRPSPN